ncbi:hypothetical protein [Cupriavidus nantongensis]|uniref:KTSC domain-containing protein n=1 Tax=Cupriavidus nantongensis TaxID=1796606 RepID=A0A142JN46_9BURK|nr:hypothetical protein [Cupriavidus nantongensis]AMR79508.1 hypothetical protein A2G96_18145 [Cupriavidus nantongensis]
MKPYRNLSGRSGIDAYELGPEYIRVRFEDGRVYTYDYRRPGRSHVEQMKRLAKAGRGLCSYISQEIGRNFADKDPSG